MRYYKRKICFRKNRSVRCGSDTGSIRLKQRTVGRRRLTPRVSLYIYIYFFYLYSRYFLHFSPQWNSSLSEEGEKVYHICLSPSAFHCSANPLFYPRRIVYAFPSSAFEGEGGSGLLSRGELKRKKGLGYVEEVHFLFRYGRRSRWSGIEGARPDSDMGGCNRVRRHHSHLHPAGEGTSSHWRGETKK